MWKVLAFLSVCLTLMPLQSSLQCISNDLYWQFIYYVGTTLKYPRSIFVSKELTGYGRGWWWWSRPPPSLICPASLPCYMPCLCFPSHVLPVSVCWSLWVLTEWYSSSGWCYDSMCCHNILLWHVYNSAHIYAASTVAFWIGLYRICN